MSAHHRGEKAMSDHASDRRTFLKRVGAASAAAVASRLPVPGSASAQDATVKPDPAAKRGGTRRGRPSLGG